MDERTEEIMAQSKGVVVAVQSQVKELQSQVECLQEEQAYISSFIEEAVVINNRMKEIECIFYRVLSEIQQYHQELAELSDQLRSKTEEHKMLQSTFERCEAWEKKHLEQDLNIPKLEVKDKILY